MAAYAIFLWHIYYLYENKAIQRINFLRNNRHGKNNSPNIFYFSGVFGQSQFLRRLAASKLKICAGAYSAKR